MPTFAEKVDIFSFMASQLAFPIYPHVLQRVVAAKSTNILKISWATLPIVCYLAQVNIDAHIRTHTRIHTHTHTRTHTYTHICMHAH
jgi:hypothetical protein